MLVGVVFASPLVPGARASAAAGPDSHIAWTPCPQVSGYLCGTLPVPLDYQNPSKGSVLLAVIEHRVAHSRGVVIFNPGGPGESGVLILPVLTGAVPVVRDDFTLVSFDERGTGSSDPLLCGPSVAAAGSATAGTTAATRVFAHLERSCRADHPALFPTVNTTTSARDMNQLRIALGVDRINYYGVSYGTVLGSVYRQLFPAHVRAVVLDGAVDANLSLTTDATLEAPAINAAIKYELLHCPDSATCPLGAHPVTLYRDLEQRLARSPLPAPGRGDDLPVTEGDLATATLLYLSIPALGPGYFSALASATAGNGAPLRAEAEELDTDTNGASLVGPLWTITCNDAATHPDARATAALARSLQKRYPFGGAEAVANNLIGCPGWTGRTEPVAHLHPISAPTPLVIGNTGDPNTPYAGARALTATIGGRLVTYVAYGHSWLLNGSSNACMQKVVGDYIADDTLPPRGTRCRA